MEKTNPSTPDLTQENIIKIAELFPDVITEAIDDSGNLVKAVDFDALKENLSSSVVEGKRERYQFTWPGKAEAKLEVRKPIDKTMRPCPEESVDWDTTENLYIEGDNLEALKLLRDSYAGKVKMIYIDPPYNTGHDFIYDDDYSESAADYTEHSGEYDEEGGRLVANPESNGRFHSDWCSMMYPRLSLARDLLSDNGVIFISIDESEHINIGKICDEVFGAVNKVCTFVWMSKTGGGSDNNLVVTDQEYVIAYARNVMSGQCICYEEVEAEPLDNADEKGPYRIGRELNKWGANSRREDRPTMFFPITGPNGEDVFPIRNDGSEGRWRWGKQKMTEIVEAGDAAFVSRNDGTYIVYEKIRSTDNRKKPFRTFLKECGSTADGSKAVKELFDGTKIFDFPKPVGLMQQLIRIGTVSNDLVLDFFSGSASTAEGIFRQNINDARSRRFIMVQLPESCSPDSEATKNGYKTLCDIGKERIRRVGNRVREEFESAESKRAGQLNLERDKDVPALLDLGFRVLKIDSSNFRETHTSPAEYQQASLDDLTDNLKADRSELDLLFQVLPKFRIPYSAKVETIDIAGKSVFNVNDGQLLACFDVSVGTDTIEAIAKQKPVYAVFRDASMADDSTAANFEELFKTFSPDTIRRVI